MLQGLPAAAAAGGPSEWSKRSLHEEEGSLCSTPPHLQVFPEGLQRPRQERVFCRVTTSQEHQSYTIPRHLCMNIQEALDEFPNSASGEFIALMVLYTLISLVRLIKVTSRSFFSYQVPREQSKSDIVRWTHGLSSRLLQRLRQGNHKFFGQSRKRN